MKDYDYQFISRKVKTKKSPLKKILLFAEIRWHIVVLVQLQMQYKQTLEDQIDQKLADFSVDASETKDKKVKSEEKIFD